MKTQVDCKIFLVILPFFRSSGLPFLTVATTISPLAAAGSLFSRPLIPATAMMYKFFPPKLQVTNNVQKSNEL